MHIFSYPESIIRLTLVFHLRHTAYENQTFIIHENVFFFFFWLYTFIQYFFFGQKSCKILKIYFLQKRRINDSFPLASTLVISVHTYAHMLPADHLSIHMHRQKQRKFGNVQYFLCFSQQCSTDKF